MHPYTLLQLLRICWFKLINEGTATVKVLDTTSKWFGVTYAADRQSVVDKIQALVDAGEYPAKLF
jgi:hypothetical protein